MNRGIIASYIPCNQVIIWKLGTYDVIDFSFDIIDL